MTAVKSKKEIGHEVKALKNIHVTFNKGKT